MSRGDEGRLFQILDVDFSELGRYPDGLRDIMARRFDGMIIRNVLPREAVASVLAAVQRGDERLTRYGIAVRGKGAYPHTIPRTLINSMGHMDEYLNMAGPFRQTLEALFAGFEPFEARMGQALGAMSSGLPVDVLHSEEGQSYLSGSFRVLPPGSEIGLHAGNDLLLNLPENQQIHRILDCEDQLSFFICLQPAEEGGDLNLFNLEYQDTDRGETVNGLPLWFAINAYERMPVSPGAGDMVLFDGGRIYHEVSEVGGARERVTLGGFLALSHDHSRIYYWS